MVMAMLIKCEAGGGTLTKQGFELGTRSDICRSPRTTHMTVQANDPVRCRHHDMQIVGNQQNSAIKPIANILNELVEGKFTIEIHPLDRLIKHKKFR